MNQTLYPPTQIKLHKTSGVVNVVWRNGDASQISGEALRQFCACSKCRSRNAVGLRLIGESGEVVNLALIGGTGVQVVFADGHDRGIYPWEYLHKIAEGSALEYLNG